MIFTVLLWAFLGIGLRLVNGAPSCRCKRAYLRPFLPPGASIERVEYVPAGGRVAEETGRNIPYPTGPTGLPELCAVTVNVSSSPISAYRFGLFLPQTVNYTQQFLTVGNGGFAGGINWLDMGQGPHFGMATMSTDTGHNSSVVNATWALNNKERLEDWGWRAMHGSVELSKVLINAYYPAKPLLRSYYTGCSTGGRQGLKEIQNFPLSFDGALIGAPAWNVKIANPFALHLGLYNQPDTEPKHIPPKLFHTIAEEVTRQCDKVDGVEDGIISWPERCAPDLGLMQCDRPGINETKCINATQIQTVKNIWSDFVLSSTGQFLMPGILPGAEDGWSALFGSKTPSGYGIEYIKNMLYHDATWNWTTMWNETVIRDSIRINPGSATADKHDMSLFKLRGGKLIIYHGMSDGLVPTKGSQLYYNRTKAAMGLVGELTGGLDSWYRYFEVPGMLHCINTTVGAPWHIGAAFQATAMATDGWSVPGNRRNPKYDALQALMDWVEKGRAPDSLIATAWESPLNSSTPVIARRPLCPYPRKAVYNGGDVKNETSWACGTLVE